jgi:hypothetical protein
MALGVAKRVQDFIAHVDPFHSRESPPGQGKERSTSRILFQLRAVNDLEKERSAPQGFFHQTYPFGEELPPDLAVFALLEETDLFDLGVGC